MTADDGSSGGDNQWLFGNRLQMGLEFVTQGKRQMGPNSFDGGRRVER